MLVKHADPVAISKDCVDEAYRGPCFHQLIVFNATLSYCGLEPPIPADNSPWLLQFLQVPGPRSITTRWRYSILARYAP